MQNFLAFIRRFRVLLFFALLQGMALFIYFTFSSFPRAQYLTTASEFSGFIQTVRYDLTKHFALEGSNQKLIKENADLRKKLLENKLLTSTELLDDSVVKVKDNYIQHFTYIPGTVIRTTFDRTNNYFTLNIGSQQGVKRGMGVISSDGVVGIIHSTSTHFSIVKSCLTEDINITVMIESTKEPGLLKWDGRNARFGNMTGVSNDTEIKKWSKIITRGSAGIFPKGIPVGKVAGTTVVEGQPLWDVKVLYSENYRTLQYVYVIKNLLKEEQHHLEEQIPQDPIE